MRPAQWQGGKLPFKLLHTLSLLDKFKIQLSLLLTTLNKTKHSLICRHKINTAMLAFRKYLPLTYKPRFLQTWESHKLSQSLKHQDPNSQKITKALRLHSSFSPREAPSEAPYFKQSQKRLAKDSTLSFFLRLFFFLKTKLTDPQ